MKLKINEWDRDLDTRATAWKTRDNRKPVKSTWKSAKLTVTYRDKDGSVEVSDDFDVYNDKGLPYEEFESYVEDNAELLARQMCKESGIRYMSLEDIDYIDGGVESEYNPDPYDDIDHDPYL